MIRKRNTGFFASPLAKNPHMYTMAKNILYFSPYVSLWKGYENQ